MCIGIEYLVNGEPQLVRLDARGQLPVRLRGGKIVFYRWGSAGRLHPDDNTPGWLAKFPEGTHASLESVREGAWTRFAPDPVRIVASRFLMLDRWQVPRYFSIQVGEYIQGLLAHIQNDARLYVVTVPVPAEHTDEFPSPVPGWPRLVGARIR